MARNSKKFDICRLIMKSGSDNFRASAIQGVMCRLHEQVVQSCVDKPELHESQSNSMPVYQDFQSFNNEVDVVITNRIADELQVVAENFTLEINLERIKYDKK